MDLSFVEMITIGAIAFLILGPVEMVKRATQFGQFIHKIRSEVNNFKTLAQEEILKHEELAKAKQQLEDLGSEIRLQEAGQKVARTRHMSLEDKNPADLKVSVESHEQVAAAKTSISEETQIEERILSMKSSKPNRES